MCKGIGEYRAITLTTGVDVRTGSIGGDTFDGSVNANGTATFTSVDQLDGGAGTDYLIAGDLSRCPKRNFMRQVTQNLTKSGAEVGLGDTSS